MTILLKAAPSQLLIPILAGLIGLDTRWNCFFHYFARLRVKEETIFVLLLIVCILHAWFNAWYTKST